MVLVRQRQPVAYCLKVAVPLGHRTLVRREVRVDEQEARVRDLEREPDRALGLEQAAELGRDVSCLDRFNLAREFPPAMVWGCGMGWDGVGWSVIVRVSVCVCV